ncbi:MAG: hypothetical protein U0166_26310 [Acidobacteriota bacterium]
MAQNETMLTVAAAATAVGASAAAVRNWIKQDAELGKAVVKQSGVTLFSPAAVKVLEKVKERRMKAANPALQAAWAARRSGKAKPKAKVKAAKAPAKAEKPRAAGKSKAGKTLRPGLEKAWAARKRNAKIRREQKAREAKVAAKAAKATAPKGGMSGEEAARRLGISKVRLYGLLKRFDIKKPRSRGFTEPVMSEVSRALSQGKAALGKAAKAAGKKVRAATPAPVREAAARVSATAEGAFHKALEVITELLAQQRLILERVARPIRVRVEPEE